MTALKKLPPDFSVEDYPLSVGLLEAVELSETVKTRLKADKKLAICLTVSGEVPTTREAAEIVGTSIGAIYKSRTTKASKQYEKQAQKMLLSGEGHKAIGRIAQLARQEKSLSVAMRANEWLAGVNGVGPAQKHEINHSGGAPSVGMMIIHPDALQSGQLEALIPLAGDTKSPRIEVEDAEIIEEN